MRIEALTVALRPRSPWEAVELGSALLRQHAGAVWKPWLMLSLPVFVLLNVALWMLDTLWLAGLLMWWLKPWFDRVPLHVLSRAVFGDVPTWRQALRAAFNGRLLLAHLTWRRLGPVRALYLPIDLLEGNDGEQARDRRRVLGGPVYGVAALLTAMFVHFELALAGGLVALAVLFIPQELLPETGKRVWELMQLQPHWMELGFNIVAWLATCVMEPFYVAAGFGLYLNRRTQIEAWDIELALRRLRSRLQAMATSTLLVLCLLGSLAWMPSGRAQVSDAATAPVGATPTRPAQSTPTQRAVTPERVDRLVGGRPSAPQAPAEPAPTTAIAPAAPKRSEPICTPEHSLARPLRDAFGKAFVDDRELQRAVKRAYADPTLSPKRTVTTWEPRDPKKPEKEEQPLPPWLAAFGVFMASAGEFVLWGLLAVLVGVLAWTARRWWPWLRNAVTAPPRESDELRHAIAPPEPEALPADIPRAVQALWQVGRAREALALLYRGSVAAMVERTGAVLVPGATEAQCLRASRQLPLAEERDAFARVVRVWQYLAYAGQAPRQDQFDELLASATQHFGWSR